MASNDFVTFITGATGFVGAAVARKLIAEGHNLRALVRPNNDRSNLEGLDIELVEGDLTDPASYRGTLKDCRALFHVAADYRIWVPDPAAMHLANVEGTHALMKAAIKAKVERIVYTSSVATLGLHPDGLASDENMRVSYDDMIGIYKQSKYRAEEVVHRLIKDENLPAIIVNPSTPVGPRDIKPTPTGRIIVDAARGRIPAYVDTGLNIVHVDDVANGHWLAYEKGQVGQRYILGGENKTLSEILTMVAEQVGRKPPTIKVPREAIFPIAAVAELIARFTKKEPLVTIDALLMAKKKMFFSSRKAEEQLGYTARPAAEAIADAITWFKENRYF